jgi:hypothetical protein
MNISLGIEALLQEIDRANDAVIADNKKNARKGAVICWECGKDATFDSGPILGAYCNDHV